MMKVETKVANFDGDIGQLIKKYSDRFVPTPIGRTDVNKYGLYIERGDGIYLLMISGHGEPAISYNVIITVMGPRQEIAEQIMQEFQSKIEIETRSPPSYLQRQFEEIAALL